MPGDLRETLQRTLGGTYTLECELGAGGMATVYLSEDVLHHRKVAVKVLHPELAESLGRERLALRRDGATCVGADAHESYPLR